MLLSKRVKTQLIWNKCFMFYETDLETFWYFIIFSFTKGERERDY